MLCSTQLISLANPEPGAGSVLTVVPAFSDTFSSSFLGPSHTLFPFFLVLRCSAILPLVVWLPVPHFLQKLFFSPVVLFTENVAGRGVMTSTLLHTRRFQ